MNEKQRSILGFVVVLELILLGIIGYVIGMYLYHDALSYGYSEMTAMFATIAVQVIVLYLYLEISRYFIRRLVFRFTINNITSMVAERYKQTGDLAQAVDDTSKAIKD